MKKKLSILFILFFGILLNSNDSSAQYLESDPSPAQRIFYGGSLGLSFGTFTNISVDPVVGYRITNRLSAGIGGNYIYLASRQFNYSYSIWGGNLFASYTLIKSLNDILPFSSQGTSILIYGEYNLMNVSNYYSDLNMTRTWQENPMLGVAIQSRIGKRSFALIKILYNFNESFYSLYPNPVLKVSFQF